MKKILLPIIFFINFLYSAQVEELLWPKGESFLAFLEKKSIPSKLYYDLDKEDKELCSEIQTNSRFYLYTEDDGSFSQVLIPVSLEMQIHIYKDKSNNYKLQTIPINYTENFEKFAISISESIYSDIQKITGDVALSAVINSLFSGVDFTKIKKGDFVSVEYKQRVYLGKRLGMPEIQSVMVEVNKKPYYRFLHDKDEVYYDEKGVGFTKIYLFQIPLTYTRISSSFSNKRYHPVLKKYRAHLGVDFAAPAGRNIYAASDGRVEFIGTKGGYGKTIIINHQNGYKTLYAHQKGFAKGIKQGRIVRKGELIGYVGSTGLSTGSHLHLGLYRNNVAIDPLKVIKKPKIVGLDPKEKPVFLEYAKNTIVKLNQEIQNENSIAPKKLDRIYDRSIVDIY